MDEGRWASEGTLCRANPFCPAGHLPHKGGEWQEA